MAEFLHIETSGGAELEHELGAALARLERPRELMEAVGQVLAANIEHRFDVKRDPNGGAWAAIAASTRARYDKLDTRGRGPRAGEVVRRGTLLERTGRMRASLAVVAGDDEVSVGMARLSADGRWSIPLLHETGTTRMPRRGLFLADPEAGTLGAGDQADVMAEIEGFLDGVFEPS